MAIQSVPRRDLSNNTPPSLLLLPKVAPLKVEDIFNDENLLSRALDKHSLTKQQIYLLSELEGLDPGKGQRHTAMEIVVASPLESLKISVENQ